MGNKRGATAESDGATRPLPIATETGEQPSLDGLDPEVQRHIIQSRERTKKYLARVGMVPWLTVPGAATAAAYFLAGEQTQVDLNMALGLTVAVSAPAALLKILWDKRRKMSQRKKITKLENDNQGLREKLAHLEGRLFELEKARKAAPKAGGRGRT